MKHSPTSRRTPFRQVGVIVKKEFRQVFRTKIMIGILFVMPLIQTLILGFAITNEVTDVPLVICDLDDTRLSRELIGGFEHTTSFWIVERTRNPERVEREILAWNATAGLILPRGFARDLQSGKQPRVQILMDGIDGNTAGIAAGYAGEIIGDFSEKVMSEKLRKSGLPARGGSRIDLRTRMWYNPDLDNAQYMVPGIVVILVTITTMLLSSMALVREKEIGTLEQLLVTPLKKWQLLTGKVLPFLILGYMEMFIALVAARFVFDLHIAGSMADLALVTGIYIFTTLGLGIFISTRTSTQQQAMFFSWFGMIFLILLSGLFIPIDNMPHAIQLITRVNPMRYFITVIRGIFLKGSTLTMLRQPVLILAGYGLVVFSMGVWFFRKRVK